ncbi:MAG: hypothetical protein OXC18_23425 [Desulfurellaceae bacterium]|nr:hypothetical protein [Desulfurellaceae bacterium]
MKRHLQSFWLLFLLTTNPAIADTKNVEVDIGGVKIDVKAPNGFYEISSLSSETRKIAETMTPPTNRLLAVFVSEEDLGRIVKGESPIFERYIFLQVFRRLEATTISNTDFQKLITHFKGQQNILFDENKDMVDSLLEGATKKMSKEYDFSLKMKLGENISLGIFLEQPNAFGAVNLVKYRVNAEGKELDSIVAGGISYVLTRGKLLYAYVYSVYETQDDVDWVRAKSKEWVNSLLASNETSTSDSAQSSSPITGIDWERIVSKGIVGAVVGGLLALIIGLFRRMKSSFKRDIKNV